MTSRYNSSKDGFSHTDQDSCWNVISYLQYTYFTSYKSIKNNEPPPPKYQHSDLLIKQWPSCQSLLKGQSQTNAFICPPYEKAQFFRINSLSLVIRNHSNEGFFFLFLLIISLQTKQ